MLDRLELWYTTCWEVQDNVEHHHSENRELVELDEYLTSLQHLTECIGKLYEIWKEYQDVLDSNVYTTLDNRLTGYQLLHQELEGLIF